MTARGLIISSILLLIVLALIGCSTTPNIVHVNYASDPALVVALLQDKINQARALYMIIQRDLEDKRFPEADLMKVAHEQQMRLDYIQKQENVLRDMLLEDVSKLRLKVFTQKE